MHLLTYLCNSCEHGSQSKCEEIKKVSLRWKNYRSGVGKILNVTRCSRSSILNAVRELIIGVKIASQVYGSAIQTRKDMEGFKRFFVYYKWQIRF